LREHNSIGGKGLCFNQVKRGGDGAWVDRIASNKIQRQTKTTPAQTISEYKKVRKANPDRMWLITSGLLFETPSGRRFAEAVCGRTGYTV